MEIKKILMPLDNGNLVLSGYDTEKDLKKAGEDIKRALRILADMSLYNIIKELAPYRLEAARKSQQEYDDITEGLKQ